MFIQTEQTPNPATLKFLPGRTVMESGTANFPDADAAARSPLAERLFQLPEVGGVFLGADFITVTKSEDSDWRQLKPAVLAAIMEHFTAGRPVIDRRRRKRPRRGEPRRMTRSSRRSRSCWRRACARRSRMDGGDITFEDFEDGIVYLHMQGACSGCPSSTATLKAGIENMLRHYIPEVLEVRAV